MRAGGRRKALTALLDARDEADVLVDAPRAPPAMTCPTHAPFALRREDAAALPGVGRRGATSALHLADAPLRNNGAGSVRRSMKEGEIIESLLSQTSAKTIGWKTDPHPDLRH